MTRLLLTILTFVGLISLATGGGMMLRQALGHGDGDAMQHDYPVEARMGGY